ncbi:DUF3488 and transglutaminase-like domain-containing protein [Marinobacter sp. X15-166B]|uniref:transglutaminase family protein n=1 Tax=Marinobacter sp. X15-166B TaxID=1897620 RepID=UPI000A884BCA|nr:DUF3488 and transglutaminase-like domain-containing protein [Marinobacter sp. X15-166B]
MTQTVTPPRAPVQLPGLALLWLVAAFFLLLTPQVDRLPAWLLVVCAALAGWRWLVQAGRVRLPGKWVRIALTVGLVGVYLATVSAQFTVDTAASFFVMAVGLKWLETRSARDFYVLFFILVYLASVNFLFEQGPLWAVVNLFAVLCLLIGLQILNAPDLPGALSAGWRRMAVMLVKTLPVVIVLFVFFPRIAPLWSVPLVSSEARTGISERMTPGDISTLAQSSERAFRVSFGGAIPPHRDRYWRGLILDTLEGETWLQGRPKTTTKAGRVAVEGQVGSLADDEYEVLLEPTYQSWVYTLDDSIAVSDNIYRADNGVFRLHRPADTALSYRLQRTAYTPKAARLSTVERQRYLQLPTTGNPQARALAQTLRQTYPDPWDLVSAILERFRNQPYFYTLRPPGMPANGVDALLFDAKRGFCAHYAGATAFLLRAAGVPARVVIGYQRGGAGGQ